VDRAELDAVALALADLVVGSKRSAARRAEWELIQAGTEAAERASGRHTVEVDRRAASGARPGRGAVDIGWSTGNTSWVTQRMFRSDGTLVAEVTSVSGPLDLTERRLLPGPTDAGGPFPATRGLLAWADRSGTRPARLG
jgi:hypothetical protein